MKIKRLNESGYKLTIKKDGKTFNDYCYDYRKESAVAQMKAKYGDDIEVLDVVEHNKIEEDFGFKSGNKYLGGLPSEPSSLEYGRAMNKAYLESDKFKKEKQDVIDFAEACKLDGSPCEDYHEFAKILADDGIVATDTLWNIYLDALDDSVNESESINESMSTELKNYLEKVKKLELKAMYSLDPDDDAFGIETDLYARVSETLDGKRTPESLLAYFEKYYSEYEKDFIDNIKKLINSDSTRDSNINESKSISGSIKVGDNVKVNTPGNDFYNGRTGVVDYVEGEIITVTFDDKKSPRLNNFDLNQVSKINESKSIKESSDDIFANNMEEFCNKLDLEYKWGEGIFYPKWDAYNEFRNKLDAAGLKDTTFWYFQGSNPDKGRGNPDADICVSVEDEDSYAMVEVYKFPIYKKSAKSIKESSATHCVYFTQDGRDQIEFEGTEDECYNYIASIESEQDDEFGDESPERFIKRLDETVTENKPIKKSLKYSQESFDKAYQFLKDATDNFTKEGRFTLPEDINSTACEDILSNYYENSGLTGDSENPTYPEEVRAYKPIKENVERPNMNEASYGGAFDIADNQYFTREDLDNFSEEVLNHINETFVTQFDVSACYIDDGVLELEVTNDEYGDYTMSEKIDMRKIKEPWHLKREYASWFASELINDIKRSNDGLIEDLNESVTSDAKPIETGVAVGMAAVLSDLIKDEYEAIEGYNSAIATAEAEGYGDMVKVLTDIQAEENIHIGQLQELMKMVDPNAHKIEDGYAEAAEELANPVEDNIIDDDDVLVLVTEGVDCDDDIADEDVEDLIKKVEEAMNAPAIEENVPTLIDEFEEDEIIVESTEPWEDIYKSFKDIEVQLNGDGEAITATIDRIYQDNKDNPDFEKAYQRWASNE